MLVGWWSGEVVRWCGGIVVVVGEWWWRVVESVAWEVRGSWVWWWVVVWWGGCEVCVVMCGSVCEVVVVWCV